MDNLEKYAKLIVQVGINIKYGQTLMISSPIECYEFVRLISKEAYENGAREVIMRWNDEISEKIRYNHAHEEIFDEFPSWLVDMYNQTAYKDTAYLSIYASDPLLMKDVNPKRISRQNKARNLALSEYRTRIMGDKNAWCLVSIPTDSWANKVFPDKENAKELLWNSIYKAVRVDQEDPIASWISHQKMIKEKLDLLNGAKFRKLIYKNSLGTNFSIELPDGHFWAGGGSKTPLGQDFVANMPTEEVFTLPKSNSANGKVVSSMPLHYNGNLIKDFSFTFKDGFIVDYNAKEGLEILKEMLESDEGAKRLGEVALVPYDSPISNQKILFYNTLFDENASCHLALGKAYPMIKDADNMSGDKLQELGVNDSLIHVDFMIGTNDLNILGLKENGDEVSIFTNGNWAGVY